MIKIKLSNEKSILNFHYNNLTTSTGKEQHIIARLDRRIKKNVGNLSAMYKYLKNKTEKDSSGFSILIAKPDELADFVNTFSTQYGHLITGTIKDDFENIYYYNQYDRWNAYALASKIGLTTCPYCNRMYTFIVGTDKNKGTRFEFDHFFPKSEYPYLALSFYNIVPSCHICNSNLKGKKKFNLDDNIHPYKEGFSDNILFSIKPKSIGFINGKSKSYRIKFKRGMTTWSDKKVRAALNNISAFELTRLYNMHKDYVDELIQQSKIYNKDYIDSLFNQYAGTLFQNKEDVKRMLLSNYINEEDYHKRVLSKLTADISKELGLFE